MPAPASQSVSGAVLISFLVIVNHWHWKGLANVWFGSGWKNWQNSWISDVHSLVIVIKDIHGMDISIPIPLGLAKDSILLVSGMDFT